MANERFDNIILFMLMLFIILFAVFMIGQMDLRISRAVLYRLRQHLVNTVPQG